MPVVLLPDGHRITACYDEPPTTSQVEHTEMFTAIFNATVDELDRDGDGIARE